MQICRRWRSGATLAAHDRPLVEAQGRHEEAEAMYLRALAVFERAYGSDHYEIAVTLNNLAGVRESQGRLEEAETQYRRALAIKQALFGPDHPDVAMTENNLALLLASSDRSVEAEPLYARALETFAPSSLLVIQRCRAVRPTTSALLQEQGRDAAARALAERYAVDLETPDARR